MKAFNVTFHEQDQVKPMEVKKLSEEDFHVVSSGGTRHLFELDTNVGFFVYFDSEDEAGNEHYLVLHYEEDQEDPIACYEFELKDFYQFTALYLNDLEFNEEIDEKEEKAEEQEYTPIHYLAHLMYHIVEDGNKAEL